MDEANNRRVTGLIRLVQRQQNLLNDRTQQLMIVQCQLAAEQSRARVRTALDRIALVLMLAHLLL